MKDEEQNREGGGSGLQERAQLARRTKPKVRRLPRVRRRKRPDVVDIEQGPGEGRVQLLVVCILGVSLYTTLIRVLRSVKLGEQGPFLRKGKRQARKGPGLVGWKDSSTAPRHHPAALLPAAWKHRCASGDKPSQLN